MSSIRKLIEGNLLYILINIGMISHMWKFCKMSCNYCNTSNQKNDENREKPMKSADESSEEDELANTGLLLSRSNSLRETNVDKNDSEFDSDGIKTIDNSQEGNLTNSDDKSDYEGKKDSGVRYQFNPMKYFYFNIKLNIFQREQHSILDYVFLMDLNTLAFMKSNSQN